MSGLRPIANSRYTASTLLGLFRTPRWTHLGVDPEQFPPDELVKDSAEATVRFGIFSRLVEEKGHRGFLEAIAKCPPPVPFRVDIYGGPLESDFADQLTHDIVRLGLAARVQLHGEALNLAEAYHSVDVVVSCRITPEPFGLTVIEAMMSGRPVLAHAAGGPGETILDGETGWLITDASVDGIAEGLRRCLNDRPRWSSMGRVAHKHAYEHFSIKKAFDRVWTIFREDDD